MGSSKVRAVESALRFRVSAAYVSSATAAAWASMPASRAG